MTERNGSCASKGHGFSTNRGEYCIGELQVGSGVQKKAEIAGLYSVERWEIVNYI
jgi:hypothetical protein